MINDQSQIGPSGYEYDGFASEWTGQTWDTHGPREATNVVCYTFDLPTREKWQQLTNRFRSCVVTSQAERRDGGEDMETASMHF
jgi:hypothetical protein